MKRLYLTIEVNPKKLDGTIKVFFESRIQNR